MDATNGSRHYYLGPCVHDLPTWIPNRAHRETYRPPLNIHHKSRKIRIGARGIHRKFFHSQYGSRRCDPRLCISLLSRRGALAAYDSMNPWHLGTTMPVGEALGRPQMA